MMGGDTAGTTAIMDDQQPLVVQSARHRGDNNNMVLSTELETMKAKLEQEKSPVYYTHMTLPTSETVKMKVV